MNNSEVSIIEAVQGLESFSPIKITFNGVVLYDDWDFDEIKPPIETLQNRLWRYDNYVVTSISIKVVDFHHSFVHLNGELKEDREKEVELGDYDI